MTEVSTPFGVPLTESERDYLQRPSSIRLVALRERARDAADMAALQHRYAIHEQKQFSARRPLPDGFCWGKFLSVADTDYFWSREAQKCAWLLCEVAARSNRSVWE